MSIGKLARTTGLPVRTIRFYCDAGILESHRSAGGHRMFDADSATQRLLLVRQLRSLGLGLRSIVEVLHDQRSISEVIAAESAQLDIEFRSLTWRRASLRAVEAADPTERPHRLALLAAAQDGPAVHDAIAGFWRRIFAAMTPPQFDGYVAMSIPEPPVDPSVSQVVAYAELADLVTHPELYTAVWQQIWRTQPDLIRDRRGLFTDLKDACIDVMALVSKGVQPHAGAGLDRFVDAHAAARGEQDSPQFRERLLVDATDTDHRIHRYWALTAQLFGAPATVGHAHSWLYNALADSTRPAKTG
ncbi:MerR family transcriptional regulator [Nocardia sp.]|uniref:MerR family transcriptional regulator n=1 Tax=Nocardia sp. TaxID=1821 RepID=UPI002619CD8A|nr:MerR family transcriptional regulator [Nocardia sp.]